MKQLTLMLLAVALTSAVVFTGCKCPTCDEVSALEEGIDLPKGFCVLKGLDEDRDYDRVGWPRYIVRQRDGSVMALVSPKKYAMGSQKEPDEIPVHRTNVDRFYIDLYEVNNMQFARFVKQIGGNLRPDIQLNHINLNFTCNKFKLDSPCLADVLITSQTPRCCIPRNWRYTQANCMESNPCSYYHTVVLEPSYFNEYWVAGINDSHPARAVSFWEAWYYCRWVGKDLPTEAEWELAAKGGDNRLYPWGNIEPDSQHLRCNYAGVKSSEDGYEYTSPVSAFAAGRSPVGCYNMAGNVAEWTKDKYDASIYAADKFARGRGRSSETNRQMTDPTGPTFGEARVVRGGSYASDIYQCRATARQAAKPNTHDMRIGFRGVLRIR